MKKLKLAFSILSFAILLIGCKTVNELQEKDNSPTLLLEHESKLDLMKL
jgi:PBP1b-binding outer membrane lipoprotein LpoB